jgi:anti-sigma factor RsiW
MKSLTFRDIEQLCAYLDGELSESERKRLEKRIHSEPALAAKLDEICDTCELLHSLPKRRAPRNFTLTPKTAGIRAPIPRLVPVFSWASAVAMLLFIFTLGSGLFRQFSTSATAPMLAAAPGGMGGGPTGAPLMAAPATAAPAMAAPATAAPALPRATDQAVQETPNAEAFSMPVPQATPPPAAKESRPPATMKTQPKTFSPWLALWAGLGVLLAILALLLWGQNQLAFRRKNRKR